MLTVGEQKIIKCSDGTTATCSSGTQGCADYSPLYCPVTANYTGTVMLMFNDLASKQVASASSNQVFTATASASASQKGPTQQEAFDAAMIVAKQKANDSLNVLIYQFLSTMYPVGPVAVWGKKAECLKNSLQSAKSTSAHICGDSYSCTKSCSANPCNNGSKTTVNECVNYVGVFADGTSYDYNVCSVIKSPTCCGTCPCSSPLVMSNCICGTYPSDVTNYSPCPTCA
jgi:hypothetical protein